MKHLFFKFVAFCVVFSPMSIQAQNQNSAQIVLEMESWCDSLQKRLQKSERQIDSLLRNDILLEQRLSTCQQQDSFRQWQIDTLRSSLLDFIETQSNTNVILQSNISRLQIEGESLEGCLDSLRIGVCRLAKTQSSDRVSLNGQIQKTNAGVQANNALLSERTLWGGIIGGVLFALLVISVTFLQRRIKSGKTSLTEIRKAQNALQAAQLKIEEESLSLDNKLLQLVEKQIATAQHVPAADNKTPDHSLALKVADEITRIEMNLSRMDSTVKGHKQLSKAVERIKSNFLANGYEMVDMLGKPYHEGMKVIANFVSDENLKEGEQIITGIIKPQINYNGQMIQAAQITVSQNI